MNEMYWITRLDAINALLWAIVATLIITYIVIGFFWAVSDVVIKEKDEKETFRKLRKVAKYSISICVICLMGVVFLPSEEDMYKIYGIGGTYEYLRDNDTAKQLPDKAIKALDRLLDIEIERNNNRSETPPHLKPLENGRNK